MKNVLRRTAAPLALATLAAAIACSSRDTAVPGSSLPVRRTTDNRVVASPGAPDAPWKRRANRAFSRPDRIVRFAAQGSAAARDIELVRGGEIIGRVRTEWSGAPGASRARRRVLTLYRDGAATRTFELPPEGWMSGGAPSGTGASPSPFRAAAATGVAAVGAVDSASCDAQFDAMFDAIDSYWAADAALGECFTSAANCLGAAIAFVDSSRELLGAAESLGACLAVT